MIYDSFMFYKDLDLLEIRLEEHWDIVDKFVLTEAPFTQSCKSKPLYYKDNKDRFKKYQDKIVHLEMDGLGFHKIKHFYNERLQRNHFRRVLNYKDDDIFILSDADEIMNSRVVKERDLFEETRKHGIVQTNLSFHHYYVNYIVRDFKWTGAVFVTGEMLKSNRPSHVRRKANDLRLRMIVDNVGWHFSWLGGIDKVYDKLEAVCNKEYVTEHYLVEMDFDTRIKEGITFNFLTDGYKLTLDNDMELPKYLVDNKERFKDYFYGSV